MTQNRISINYIYGQSRTNTN